MRARGDIDLDAVDARRKADIDQLKAELDRQKDRERQAFEALQAAQCRERAAEQREREEPGDREAYEALLDARQKAHTAEQEWVEASNSTAVAASAYGVLHDGRFLDAAQVALALRQARVSRAAHLNSGTTSVRLKTAARTESHLHRQNNACESMQDERQG